MPNSDLPALTFPGWDGGVRGLLGQAIHEQCYALTGPLGAFLLPSTLRLTGPTRGEPSLTLDRPPGSSVPFALGDGISPLLPLTFSGPLIFETEVEKDLFVAELHAHAETATGLERMEKAGPLGTAPGYARWTPGERVTEGTLTVTLYPSARPLINGIEVDW